MNDIEIKKSDVKLKLISSKDIGGTFKVEYSVNILKKGLEDPSIKLTMRNVDSSSLKKAIFANLKKQDEEYMDLISFDVTKAIFHLKFDKWLKDAAKGIKGVKDIKSFSIDFKLKELPPPMIKKDSLKTEWDSFLVRKFKKWVSEKKNRESRLLNIIFPNSVVSSVNTRLYNMFDWKYNNRLNKIEATLKSIWVSALLYSTIKLTKIEGAEKFEKETRAKLFSIKVKKEIARKKKSKKKK